MHLLPCYYSGHTVQILPVSLGVFTSHKCLALEDVTATDRRARGDTGHREVRGLGEPTSSEIVHVSALCTWETGAADFCCSHVDTDLSTMQALSRDNAPWPSALSIPQRCHLAGTGL